MRISLSNTEVEFLLTNLKGDLVHHQALYDNSDDDSGVNRPLVLKSIEIQKSLLNKLGVDAEKFITNERRKLKRKGMWR